MVNGDCITQEIGSVLIRNCSLKGSAQCLLLMLWRAAHQRHHNVPIRDGDRTTNSYTLAFAERLVLARNSRQRAPSIMTGLHRKADVDDLTAGIGAPQSGRRCFASLGTTG
jgi:hypothetical protein